MPMLQVRTLNGEKVWRRRHYRVRRGNAVGAIDVPADPCLCLTYCHAYS